MSNKIFIAKSADVVGNVKLGEGSSVWFQSVIRGDFMPITIGAGTNVQDGVVIHVDLETPTTIGDGVSLGHSAIVHGCEIRDNVLVGMGAKILTGAVIHENCLIGANSLVTEGTVIPANSLVLGSPARVVRQLTEAEVNNNRKNAQVYQENAKKFVGQSFEITTEGYVVVEE